MPHFPVANVFHPYTADFAVEIWSSLSFFINAMLGRHQASREARGRAIRPNFEEAFGVEGGYRSAPRKSESGDFNTGLYDDNIRLAQYSLPEQGRRR